MFKNPPKIPQSIADDDLPTHGSKDPCHKYACPIQTCLERNNYNQEKCKAEVTKYNDCVKKLIEEREKLKNAKQSTG
ncbi:CMC4 [Acrasis kona]|uniref:CMC4 n=1 Tax=Acrasis kona TaxID=1008807 RepID=A0AAW2YMC2_9EUKA